ncbi:MAG TPA: hypothetical protein DDZ22_16580, partial [Massilia sp.]|nr:hypothetical protein [Massilia sp.]
RRRGSGSRRSLCAGGALRQRRLHGAEFAHGQDNCEVQGLPAWRGAGGAWLDAGLLGTVSL